VPASPAVFAALPVGLQGIDADLVTVSQRGRLLDAMAAVVAQRGYAAATIADVVRQAGVSRKTFYEHFSDKEDCFLAAHALGVQLVVARLKAAMEGVDDPVERLRLGIAAYLATLAEAPAFARTFEVEVLAAGDRALAQRDRSMAGFAELMRPAGPDTGDPRLDERLRRAAVAAIADLVAAEVRGERKPKLAELAEPATAIAFRLLGLDARQ
jgi:AcrR family transcriptional regulator